MISARAIVPLGILCRLQHYYLLTVTRVPLRVPPTSASYFILLSEQNTSLKILAFQIEEPASAPAVGCICVTQMSAVVDAVI